MEREEFLGLLEQPTIAGNPQRVTRRGQPAVVVLAVAEYERLRHLEKTAAPTLADLLLSIPQDDEDFERLRVPLPARRSLMFLLDTDVLSDLRRRERNPRLVRWVSSQRTADLYLSVVSIGEIERGIARKRSRDPAFARVLAGWLDTVLRVVRRADSRR